MAALAPCALLAGKAMAAPTVNRGTTDTCVRPDEGSPKAKSHCHTKLSITEAKPQIAAREHI